MGQQFVLGVSGAMLTDIGDSFGAVTAGSTGGSCSGSANYWYCDPGSSGWQQGAIDLQISTQKATSCSGSGVNEQCSAASIGVTMFGDNFSVLGSTSGSIQIKATQTASAPSSPAADKSSAPSAGHTQAVVAAKSSAKASVSASPSAATGAPTAAVAADVTSVSAESSAPVVLDAAKTAKSSSTSHVVAGGIPVAILVLVLGFITWRFGRRRK